MTTLLKSVVSACVVAAAVLVAAPASAQLTGACCRARGDTFACSDRVQLSTCAEGSGVSYVGTVCSSDPCGTAPDVAVACCAPNQQCALATAVDCVLAIDGLIPIPEAPVCLPDTCTDSRLPALGACCVADGCEIATVEGCDRIGGHWNAGDVCFDGVCGLTEAFPVEGGGVGGCMSGGRSTTNAAWLLAAALLASRRRSLAR